MTFNCYERSAVCSRRIHLTWVEWLNVDSPFSLQIASGGASTTFLLKTSNRSYWDKNPKTRASLIPSPSTHWSILSPVSTTVFLTHEAITSCPCISTHKNTSLLPVLLVAQHHILHITVSFPERILPWPLVSLLPFHQYTTTYSFSS